MRRQNLTSEARGQKFFFSVRVREPMKPRFLGGLLALLVLVEGLAAEHSSVVVPGESRPTARRLDEISKQLKAKNWESALAEIRSVLDRAGDDLAPVDERHSIRARTLCQILLTHLPPPQRQAYRQRIDSLGRKWFEEGSLHRVIEEAFLSTTTESALQQLGDQAFAAGYFQEAIQWWQLLLSRNREDSKREEAIPSLHYPDGKGDLALVQAKVLLAQRYLGSDPRWQANLARFREQHPDAEGAFAGREGKYADILRDVSTNDLLPGPQTTTLGGDDSRGGIVRRFDRGGDANTLPRATLLRYLGELCRRGPTWTFDLGTRQPILAPPLPLQVVSPSRRARSLAFHPLLVRIPGLGDRPDHLYAVVADSRRITAYDLRRGQSEVWYDAGKFVGGLPEEAPLPVQADLSYTLTRADGALFVRLGLQQIQDVRPEKGPANNESLLVCLDLPRRAGEKPRPRWLVRALPEKHAVFEGTPLVHDGRVYLAATRCEGGRTITALLCYATRPEDTVPPLLWSTDVCSTTELQQGEDAKRARHHLLTRAGRFLIYCSHSGVVVAVDRLTGKRCWAYRYRHLALDPETHTESRWAGVGAPVFADHKVFVAPTDSDVLVALDAQTGTLLWERERLGVVDLLGVGQGRLIFTTDRGLRALRAEDGSSEGGWVLPDSGSRLPPMGRGLLVADLVLWPTDRQPWGVFAVRQEDGQQPFANDPSLLRRIPAGNLVLEEGCLLVADRQTLYAFTPDREEGPEPTAPPASPDRKSSPEERLRDLLEQVRSQQRHSGEFRSGGKARVTQIWNEILSTPDLHAVPVWNEQGVPMSARQLAKSALQPGPPPTVSQPDPSSTASAKRLQDRAIAREASADLAPGEQLLVQEDSSLLCTARAAGAGIPTTPWPLPPRSAGGTLIGRSLRSGQPLWKCSLPFVPAWAASHGTFILAGGPRGLAGIREKDGTLIWEFRPPRINLYPCGERGPTVVVGPSTSGPLGSFHLCAGRLFCMQARQRLLALDASSGQVLWQQLAPGAPFYPDASETAGRFHPDFVALKSPAVVLLQTTSGKRWVLEAATGKRVLIADDPAPWPRGPLVLGDALALVCSPDELLLLDRQTGKERWRFRPENPTTLSGEALEVMGKGNLLLVMIPTNLGYKVQRLDLSSGRPLWKNALFFSHDERPGRSHWSFAPGSGTIVVGHGQTWTAIDPEQGSVVWQRSLPPIPPGSRDPSAITWRIAQYTSRRGDGADGALPRTWALAWPESRPVIRWQFRWLLGSFLWTMNYSSISGDEPEFALLVHEAKTGRPQQRWDFSVMPRLEHQQRAGPRVSVIPLLTGERTLSPSPVRVQFGNDGIAVACSGKLRLLPLPPGK
jgi:outer membrane protein assembly factor BamB